MGKKFQTHDGFKNQPNPTRRGQGWARFGCQVEAIL
jgi:hypothetical protein